MTIELSLYDPTLTYKGQKQFDCGHVIINTFVHNSLKPQVKKNLSVGYVLTDAGEADRFVGFYTMAQHSIDVSLLSVMELGSLPRQIPCSRLVMLGVDKLYQGQKLGSKLMRHALLLTQQVAKQVGGFGMYLDADAWALGFYQKLGFTLLLGDKSPQPSPLFLPISAMWMTPPQ
ncbi:MAG: GNAT family N-acetyltransferase [Methylophilaceae bacterium]|nr:GNAT family N-acetyltransferase [Methylophilaceae bacterium]